ncbi:gene transfer agent family protein [Phaeovulum vinaykumarii]|uniref:Phage tail tube protein, GTA-gp10 n=1 Tax=Phaeovulum vinaykumarii TaxID=407234 RepID=A0A1N7JK65_9RHOB|nr:gene transfer agent family protein [Phaeovulum vinaykumarii]SIS49762.1 Phage tail tube protein, GTA-gp10 [Phaeovulum vinaykumarii]SOB89896.1 tail tube GTA-gp10-like protein [Phaeovulum vinaykumarii]
MANPWTGEVEVVVEGRAWRAKLTLGALAELEESLGAPSLVALVERFEEGRFSTRDVLAVLLAGLRAAGWPGTAADLAGARIEGGPIGAARAAGALLARAFALPEGATP